MKTLPLNKNSNWYTARFTDITLSEKRGIVVLENYFTGEKIRIKDKKSAEKIGFYLYSNPEKGINTTYVSDFQIWSNQRAFNKKYDNVENR